MLRPDETDDLTSPQSIKAYITCAAFMASVTCAMVTLGCIFERDQTGYLEFGVLTAILGAGFISMFLDLQQSNLT